MITITPNTQISKYHNTFKEKQHRKNNSNKVLKENMTMTAFGIGVAGMMILGAGIACRGNFSNSIAKRGLIYKDNVLIDSKTGKKFTGTIKSYVGKLGFNRIESQSFVDGVITEKTYKNMFGSELGGVFYKDGKECLKVNIGYPFFVPYNKAVATYRYTPDKSEVVHADRRGFSFKSVFKWARDFVKEKGWPSK